MKRWEDRVQNWCRSLGITLVATLIVAAILGAVLSITPNPNAQNGLALRSGQRPAVNSQRAGGDRPRKVAALVPKGKDAGPGGGNQKADGATSQPPTATSGVGPEPRTEKGSGDRAPGQTPSGPTSGADGTTPGSVAQAGTAQRKKSPVSWVKSLGDLHRRGFHPRTGSATKKRQAREKAEAELVAIEDPTAVPAIWHVFAGTHNHDYLIARMLDRLKSPESTKMLAALSVYSPDEKAGRLATKALKTRDPTEFVEWLASVFESPIKWRPEDTPEGRVLIIEGERADRWFLFPKPAEPGPPRPGIGIYDLDNPYMTPEQRQVAAAMNQAQAAMARAATEAQFKAGIEAVQRLNQRIKALNERAVEVLREATGQAFMAPEREEWRRWLAKRQGYPYVPPTKTRKPTFAQVVPPLYSPTFIPIPTPT